MSVMIATPVYSIQGFDYAQPMIVPAQAPFLPIQMGQPAFYNTPPPLFMPHIPPPMINSSPPPMPCYPQAVRVSPQPILNIPPPTLSPPLQKRLPIFMEIHRKGLQEKAIKESRPMNTSSTEPEMLPWNYRTALCRHFLHVGSCPKGNRCMFAHGEHQLRMNLDVAPERLNRGNCRRFALGKCEYGTNCHFNH